MLMAGNIKDNDEEAAADHLTHILVISCLVP
jgi:hypothetical protein